MKADLSARIHSAVETALAFACTYVLAFYWNLEKPFWAGFTVLMVSLPSIGQSLQKGVLRMFGTVIGAVIALVLISLFAQERMMLLSFLSVYLCIMLYLMLTNTHYGYVFFISCIVTMVICLISVHSPQDAFHLSVYRAEETLLGIGVYTVITLIFSPKTSIKMLHRGMADLMEGHRELFSMNADPEGLMGRMYAQYVAMRDIVEKIDQLVPAVRLENYQVYRHREAWERVVHASAELLELQRQWTGTLVAMKELDMSALFPALDTRLAELGNLYERLAVAGRDDAPTGASNPEETSPLRFDEEAFEHMGSTRKGLAYSAVELFERQAERCRELLALSAFLLHDGPTPVMPPASRPLRSVSVLKPEQYAYMSQMFVVFWATAGCWILFDPPGLESVTFLELTVLLGLIGLMTGEDKPLRQVLTFMVGITCTGLAYVFVYPLASNLGLFALMMGVSGFLIMLAFPRREQNFTKQAFMLPWLSIGNFTNVPSYDFNLFLTGSVTLLFGISIISLVHYALFMPNVEASFLQKEEAFFRSSERLLLDLCRYGGGRRGGLRTRFRLFLLVNRMRFLADELVILSRKLPETFVKPEIAQIFTIEVKDMALSLQGLYARLLHENEKLECPSVLPEGKSLPERLTFMTGVVRSLLDELRAHSCSGACGMAEQAADRGMVVCCAGMLKALSNTLDVLRSFPVAYDSRNRF